MFSALYLRLFIVGMLLSISTVYSQEKMNEKMGGHENGHIMVVPSDLKWVDGPQSLPKGAKIAVLEGDPTKPGPFTMRAKMPANYKIAPHTHPAVEHVTVISGACYMGLGDVFDASKATELTIGGFATMEVGTQHFFFTKTECEVQLHGIGPWGITYINPKDDPRNVTSQ